MSTDAVQPLHYFGLRRENMQRIQGRKNETGLVGSPKWVLAGDGAYLFVHFNVQPVGHLVVLLKQPRKHTIMAQAERVTLNAALGNAQICCWMFMMTQQGKCIYATSFDINPTQ